VLKLGNPNSNKIAVTLCILEYPKNSLVIRVQM